MDEKYTEGEQAAWHAGIEAGREMERQNAAVAKPVSAADGAMDRAQLSGSVSWAIAAEILGGMARNLDGVCKDQPGFIHAKGWNAALRQAIDYLQAHVTSGQPSGNAGELPTDEELKAFQQEEEFGLFCDDEEFVDIAKSVLQRFGNRPAAQSQSPASQTEATDEREAFESWAKNKKMPLARIGEQYDDFWVDHAWNGWQTRAALAQQASQHQECKEARRALAAQAQPPVSESLPYEQALFELIDKIDPGLDTGDLLSDAATASKTLSAQQASDPRTPSDMLVNGGALKMALNVLRRAGKTEVADELEKTAQQASGQDREDAVAEVSQETFNSDGTSDIIKPALPIGMKLYARPASKVKA